MTAVANPGQHDGPWDPRADDFWGDPPAAEPDLDEIDEDEDEDEDAPTYGPFYRGAPSYHRGGLHPLPVVGKAISVPKGFTGADGRPIAYNDVVAWMMDRPDDNVALRLIGVIGIDVDAYTKDGTVKRGDQTLALAEATWGPLPPTWRSTSRGGDNPSGIRFYRVPEGTELETVIKLADPETGELYGDIEIIQQRHRYAVVAPSIHPDTGAEYRWYGPGGTLSDPQPTLADFAWLPDGWLAGLASRATPVPTRPPITATPQIADPADWHPKVTEYYRNGLDAVGGAAGSRHDNTHTAVGQLARDESRGRAGATTALEMLRDRFVAAIGTDTRQRDPGREYDDMLDWWRRIVATTISTADDRREQVGAVFARLPQCDGTTATAGGAPPRTAPGVTPVPTNLGAEFWEARAGLAHIRAAAWSRYRSPDAVGLAVLARVAAITPPLYGIGPMIGTRSTLSYYVLLTGPSGTGKSSGTAIARELVQIPRADRDHVVEENLGSGEGLVELYMGEQETGEVDGKGRKIKERRQVRRGAIVGLDEGAAVDELGKRKGSTTMPTLRTMFTGAPVGQANADKGNWRNLKAGSYSLGFIMSIQPELADGFMGGAAAGDPQRFVCGSVVDPSIPDTPPAWPGPLRWRLPSRRRDGLRGSDLEFHPSIVAEVQAEALARVRGQVKVDPLDSHRGLLRLKTAGLLAVLEGRLDVNLEDWELAGLVIATSTAVRQYIIDTIRERNAQLAREGDQRAARRAKATVIATAETQEQIEQRKVEQAAVRIARYVHAHGTAKRKDLSLTLGPRLRTSMADGLASAIASKWITEDDDAYRPGRVTPS